MRTADPASLATYRGELIDAGLPGDLADRIVLSAADAAHRESYAAPTPAWAVENDEWAPGEREAAQAAIRARRAAELAEVG